MLVSTLHTNFLHESTPCLTSTKPVIPNDTLSLHTECFSTTQPPCVNPRQHTTKFCLPPSTAQDPILTSTERQAHTSPMHKPQLLSQVHTFNLWPPQLPIEPLRLLLKRHSGMPCTQLASNTTTQNSNQHWSTNTLPEHCATPSTYTYLPHIMSLTPSYTKLFQTAPKSTFPSHHIQPLAPGLPLCHSV